MNPYNKGIPPTTPRPIFFFARTSTLSILYLYDFSQTLSKPNPLKKRLRESKLLIPMLRFSKKSITKNLDAPDLSEAKSRVCNYCAEFQWNYHTHIMSSGKSTQINLNELIFVYKSSASLFLSTSPDTECLLQT